MRRENLPQETFERKMNRRRPLNMAVRTENQSGELLLNIRKILIQTSLNTATRKKKSSCTIREFLNS